ncbi:MAG: CoB--CoM heterodisulfide reductase subunit C [Methanobrevibacter sp.]|nr:CoB--CoM heterodisulfide reductase subunit C [Methanobrevibacter sp.]
MSVLERLKSLISGTKEDLDKNIPKETDPIEPVEPVSDAKQTSSEEEIEIESDSETDSVEETSVEVPVEEEEITPVEAEAPIEPKEAEEETEEVEAEAEEVEEETVEVEAEAEEAAAEEVSVEEDTEEVSAEEAVEEVPEEEVSLEEDEELDEEDYLEEEEEESLDEDDLEENEESDNMTLLNENDIYSMDDIDAEFKQKFLDAGIETVDHCFQCGTCGGTCPSGRRTPYRVRQIVRKCLLGLKDEVISDPALWMCTTCYTCQERCPRSVKIVDIIKMARNVAAHAGYMAPAHKATGSFVVKTGHGVPINDATKALRKEIGLDEVPPTTHAFPEALEEVQKICQACEFDKLIGFNMETGELE